MESILPAFAFVLALSDPYFLLQLRLMYHVLSVTLGQYYNTSRSTIGSIVGAL